MIVSIVIPAKNASPYLGECLRSIQNQTYTEWECLIVDDHSTDDTFEIIESFSKTDSRFKAFKNNGLGIIDALSMAFEASKGSFLSRMDADDIMDSQKLEQLLTVAKQNPEGVVTSYVKYFSEQVLGEGYINYEKWLNALIDQDAHYFNIYKECVLPSPNWMMKREVLVSIGGFKGLVYPEDYDLCFKLYERGVPIIGVKKILHHWRDYQNRTSRTDSNYADNSFLELKLRYFLRLEHHPSRPLYVWGAGKKGKTIARYLLNHSVDFHWITDNNQKLNVPIYGLELRPSDALPKSEKANIILSVASPGDQNGIENFLASRENLKPYWFC